VGRTGRQLVYDLSFINVDKLNTVQTGLRVVWEFVFLECQQLSTTILHLSTVLLRIKISESE